MVLFQYGILQLSPDGFAMPDIRYPISRIVVNPFEIAVINPHSSGHNSRETQENLSQIAAGFLYWQVDFWAS
ncbi:hypothetical protein J5X98_09290 [Leptothermofonsia sichuanensis E412]|uniref:hypothetical protein n=1 Tax=Leptothermofonsia sichuanensis TaxID=2917832 RepID=UPI001CA69FC6|nr:hypothetical protein [Leptothermofonsia sichuanensis]QZZ22531.1 hypothetical protein J5X98_09290 [Leptothermofonsia sichuanensis E412]